MTTIESGPPGIEVPHRWNDAWTINDLAARPRLKVDNIAGWYSLPEAVDNREARSGRYGEVVLPSAPMGKTLVYTGNIEARTLDDAVIAATGMKGAFRDRSNEKVMKLLGAVEWRYLARTMQLDADSNHAEYNPNWRFPYHIPFTLGVRMSTGRCYTAESASVSGKASAASHVLENRGNSDAEPVFTITGVAVGGTVTLYSGTLDKTLRYDNLTGGTMIVDFAARACVCGGQDNSGKLNMAASDWWDQNVPGIVPGNNNLGVTGGTWAVTFNHTSE